MKIYNNIKLRLTFLIASFILLHTGQIQGQNWDTLSTGNPEDFYSVFFVNNNLGWAVGLNGEIIHTTNGGTNWSSQSSGTTNHLLKAFFINDSTGWIAGHNGTMLHTTNAGANWQAQSLPITSSLISVYFINPSIGWATGWNGQILHTTNGGTNWSTQTSGLSDNLIDIYFVNSNTGWITGVNGIILNTTNGGSNWSSQTSGVNVGLISAQFTDVNTGWIAGYSGTVLHTTNGGTNWSTQSSGTTEDLQGIFFMNSNIGWAVGKNGTIIHTTNGGNNWSSQSSGTTEDLTDIHFINFQNGWSSGTGGTVLKYTSTGLYTEISGKNNVCEFENNVKYSVNPGADTNTWTVINGTISSGQGTHEIYVNWGTADSGIVMVKETLDSLQAEDTLTVYIHAYPEPEILGKDTICENETGIIYTVGAGADNYNWSVKGGDIISGQGTEQITIDWGYSDSAEIIIIKENFECQGFDTMNVLIKPLPLPVISGNDTVCAWQTANAFETNAGADNYIWSLDGGTITSGQGTHQILVDWESAGNGKVIISKEIDGCTGTDSLMLSILPNPEPSISGSNEVCEFTEGVIYTVSPGGDSYNWSVNGGTIASANGTDQISIDWHHAGTGSITLIKSKLGCIGFDTFNVNIVSNPVSVISGDEFVCAYSKEKMYASNPGADTYIWNVIGGSYSIGTNPHEIFIDWDDIGNGIVTLSTSMNNCISEDSLNISIEPIPEPLISGPQQVLTHVDNYTYMTDSVYGHIYNWTVQGGSIVENFGHKIQVIWNNLDTGIVFLTQTDTNSPAFCNQTFSLNVFTESLFIPEISGPNYICEQSDSIYYSLTPQPGYSYQWMLNGGIILNDYTDYIEVFWNSPGTAVVSVKQTHDMSGFDSTFYFYVEVVELPESGFTIHELTDKHGVFLEPDDLKLETYHWDFGDGNQSNETLAEHIYQSNGNWKITLVVTNSFGCINSSVDSVEITSVSVMTHNLNNFEIHMYPNPVNDLLFIEYTLTEMKRLTANIYNLHGQNIAKLFDNEVYKAGNYKLMVNINELKLSEGLYIISLLFDNQPVNSNLIQILKH